MVSVCPHWTTLPSKSCVAEPIQHTLPYGPDGSADEATAGDHRYDQEYQGNYRRLGSLGLRWIWVVAVLSHASRLGNNRHGLISGSKLRRARLRRERQQFDCARRANSARSTTPWDQS